MEPYHHTRMHFDDVVLIEALSVHKDHQSSLVLFWIKMCPEDELAIGKSYGSSVVYEQKERWGSFSFGFNASCICGPDYYCEFQKSGSN